MSSYTNCDAKYLKAIKELSGVSEEEMITSEVRVNPDFFFHEGGFSIFKEAGFELSPDMLIGLYYYCDVNEECAYLKTLKDLGVSEKDIIKFVAKNDPKIFFRAEGFSLLKEAGYEFSYGIDTLSDLYYDGPEECAYLKTLKDLGVSEKDIIKFVAKNDPDFLFHAEGFSMLREVGFDLSSVAKEIAEELIPYHIPEEECDEDELCFMELMGYLDPDDAKRYLERIPNRDSLKDMSSGFGFLKFEEPKHFKGWARIARYYLEEFVGFDDDYQIAYLSDIYRYNQELAIKFSAELIDCKEKYERYFEHLEEILSKIDYLRDEKELKAHYYEIAKTILGSIK